MAETEPEKRRVDSASSALCDAHARISETRGCFESLTWFIIGVFKLILYLIYGTLLLILLLPIVILFWIPWTFGFLTPSLWESPRKKTKRKYANGEWDHRQKQPRGVFELPGRGIERLAPGGSGFWAFWKGRAWELYELLRDLWRTVNRQGLQIGGVISGFIILVFHCEMMRHDYLSESVGLSSLHSNHRKRSLALPMSCHD